jgi:hypothetical protein
MPQVPLVDPLSAIVKQRRTSQLMIMMMHRILKRKCYFENKRCNKASRTSRHTIQKNCKALSAFWRDLTLDKNVSLPPLSALQSLENGIDWHATNAEVRVYTLHV